MSFSYGMGNNPTIDFIRLLVGDTVEDGHVWDDEEIRCAYTIQQSQFQSGMSFSGTSGQILPSPPVSYLRVAALLMDALASNRARVVMVTKLLDVTLAADASQKTATALREQAKEWREIEDNSGAFAIIEQCNTTFGFLQRWRQEIQRQYAAA